MSFRRHGSHYNFFGDASTGITMRWGDSVETNPHRAPWPELADISISNYCTKGCKFCYKDSTSEGAILSAEDYRFVLSSMQHEKWGNVFQVALGGGEPLEHPEFLKIIDITREMGIVPNFTTNGVHLNAAIAKAIRGKVGSVAISVGNGNELDPDKIKLLTNEGIKTNIHFVLDSDSIRDANKLLEGCYNDILQDINGVIFLTYKPKGRASAEHCLTLDSALERFISMTEKNECATRIGFDACFVPILMKFTGIDVDYIDACECGYFSVYIDEQMNVKPCSFANNEAYTYNLKQYDFDTIWNKKFEGYRSEMETHVCSNECKNKENCRGKCLYFEELALCFK